MVSTRRKTDSGTACHSKGMEFARFADRIKGTMSAPSKSQSTPKLRIGIDLGGTKIEFVALAYDGRELHRHRVATPRHDYDGTVHAIKESVERIERELHQRATDGVAIPGTISRITHTVKNANSVWMIGKPFD